MKKSLLRITCWLCVTTFFLITHFASHANCHQCKNRQAAELALRDIDLDVTLFVPEDIKDADFRSFLILHGYERQKLLLERITEGVRSLTFRSVLVGNYLAADQDCQETISDEELADPGFILDDKTGSINMLKSVVFTLQNLETESTASPTTSNSRVVRLFIVFTDQYYTAETDLHRFMPRASLFKGDGTDTCQSLSPTLKLLKNMFLKKNVGLFLVTPKEMMRDQWSATFKLEDSLLYPEKAALQLATAAAENEIKFDFDPSDTAMADFVKDKAVDLACRIFVEPPKDRSGIKGGRRRHFTGGTAEAQDATEEGLSRATALYKSPPLVAASHPRSWFLLAVVTVAAIAWESVY